MTNIDGRSLNHRTLEHLRRLSVKRVLAGEKPSSVAKSLGFYRTSIYKWLRTHRRIGAEGLKSRKAKGPMPKLTEPQRQHIMRWIIGRDPRQYGFDAALWTRGIVAQMIEDRFGVSLTRPSVGVLLASLEITPAKGLRRFSEQHGEPILQWKSKIGPELRKRAKRRGAEIYFLEFETQSGSALGRNYGPEAQPPVVKAAEQSQETNAFIAVNARGAFWHRSYQGPMTAALFIVLLRRLVKGRKRPVMLVVGRLPVDTAKSVAHYIQANRGRLELHLFPARAADLNPAEFVWNDLKQNRIGKKPERHHGFGGGERG